ncbi:hypothetical protein mRhiFer1_007935 [Rhinolophus ferrumequinum]|uniref:Uncharacterized protein n=1 Tax=Rhinolophus ferrumequinum TaxID=59479 RepID=A0A7J8AVC3_RHIFE|nr:hypothetical protein mRhiFer1_007935 [Rhinolophus ferrumequinum]
MHGCEEQYPTGMRGYGQQNLAKMHGSGLQEMAWVYGGGQQQGLPQLQGGGMLGRAQMPGREMQCHGGGMQGQPKIQCQGRQQGLTGCCGMGSQGLAWLLHWGGQSLVRRAGPGFRGLGLAGMRDCTEKPEVQGGSDGCWAEPLEKMAAKARSPQAREPPETDSAVEASEPRQPLRRRAASAHGLSLGSWSGSDARRPGQRRSWLAPWRLRSPQAPSGDVVPLQASRISAPPGDSGCPGAQDDPSTARSPWRAALGPPQRSKWRRVRPPHRKRHLL